MTLVDNNSEQLSEGEYLAICKFMKTSFENINNASVPQERGVDTDSDDSSDDDDFIDDDETEQPSWDELDHDPNGSLSKDNRGNIIKEGDYIRMKGSGPNYTPELVTKVFFIGYEDRTIAETWDDDGWKVQTIIEDDFFDIEDVIKVEPPTVHHLSGPPDPL